MLSLQSDVLAFHRAFKVKVGEFGVMPDKATMRLRIDMLYEEVDELDNAACIDDDYEDMADAVVDIVYVAIGAAVEMGFDFQTLWDEVHAANMEKEFRGEGVKVGKPKGWKEPDVKLALVAMEEK